MTKNIFAVKGDILYNESFNKFKTHKNSYIVVEDGKIVDTFKTLPTRFKTIKKYDYTGKLIIPGLIDLHLHAPQYSFTGLHMDLELLDWLNKYTFPEEAKYKKMEYAKKAYDIFVNDIKKSATTRFSIFGTLHKDATIYLAKSLDKIGMKGYVGKVNMDRNSPKILIETTKNSIKNTIEYVEATKHLKNVKPIITPRFIPTCTNDLMKELSIISDKYNLPIQSHLSENRSEIKWVRELLPESKSYGDAYHIFNMLGSHEKTIMAHCVWLVEADMKIMEKNKVWIAHSPSSNRNLSSGVAPIRRYLNRGIKVGLATDVAGGSYLSMFRAIEDAITISKIRNVIEDYIIEIGEGEVFQNTIKEAAPQLTIQEAFYLATRGGGMFFDDENTKIGLFEKGYEFDALVLDESHIPTPLMKELSIEDRLERFIYRPNDKLLAKFISGKKII